MMVSLPADQLAKGVVCASAGNHAQGFAYSCHKLGVKGVVFMPIITPRQKINQTRMFGEDNIEIVLIGDTFDDCNIAARQYTRDNGMTFIPPFEDLRIIEGQGTVAVEILEDLPREQPIDYLFVPVGGGGLASGTGAYFKTYSPHQSHRPGTRRRPLHARRLPRRPPRHPRQHRPLRRRRRRQTRRRTHLQYLPGSPRRYAPRTGRKVCSTILRLYNEDAIVVEPAGALSIAALDDYAAPSKAKPSSASSAAATTISTGCRRSRKAPSSTKDSNTIS
jgi:threonine dehydratase